MTDKEEIAIALLIYRAYRAKFDNLLNGYSHGPKAQIETINSRIIELAKKLEVKDEYFRNMFKFPVMSIKVKELEEWESEHPFVKPRTDFSINTNSRIKRSKENGSSLKKQKKKPKLRLKPKKSSKKSQLKSKKKPTNKSRRL